MTDREVVLITGTRKGLGRALAEHFIAKGALVEGCSRGESDWRHEGYHHHSVDVADEDAVRRMLADIRRRHGRLDVAVNNAGIASLNHSLLMPGGTLDRILATNVRGVFLVARESAKLMKERRYGRIVNLTTVAVPLLLEGEAAYAASKGAVEILTKILAREYSGLGITCNAVGPGPVDTDLIRHVPREKIDRLVSSLAIKRLGTPADVANVVDFFVRRESGCVTGQVVYLGGAG